MSEDIINPLNRVYPNRNLELRMLIKKAYEFGKNIAQEPSANLSMGVLDHAVKRQDSYVSRIREMVTALAAKPVPDKPGIHPTTYAVDLTDRYPQFQEDVNGKMTPINEETELLAGAWLELAAGLAKSQSAAIPGGMHEADKLRAVNNIDVIAKYMDEFRKRPILDVPETADAGAPLIVGGGQ